MTMLTFMSLHVFLPSVRRRSGSWPQRVDGHDHHHSLLASVRRRYRVTDTMPIATSSGWYNTQACSCPPTGYPKATCRCLTLLRVRVAELVMRKTCRELRMSGYHLHDSNGTPRTCQMVPVCGRMAFLVRHQNLPNGTCVWTYGIFGDKSVSLCCKCVL